MNDHEMLSIPDVVRETKLSTRTVNRCLTRSYRKLPSYRIGKRRLVRRKDLYQWLEQFREDILKAEAKAEAIALVRKTSGVLTGLLGSHNKS